MRCRHDHKWATAGPTCVQGLVTFAPTHLQLYVCLYVYRCASDCGACSLGPRPWGQTTGKRGLEACELGPADEGNTSEASHLVAYTLGPNTVWQGWGLQYGANRAIQDGKDGKIPDAVDRSSNLYDRRWLAPGFPLSDPRKDAITFEQVFRHTAGFGPEGLKDEGGRDLWIDYSAWVVGHDPQWPQTQRLFYPPGDP